MDDAFLKGIAPAFITLTGTIVFGLVGGWFKRHLERRSVRYALVAEIQALALIVRERRYLPSLLEAADVIDNGLLKGDEIVWFRVAVDSTYCRVYAAYTSSLGSLPAHIAQLVVTFYQFIDSVVRDVSPGGAVYEGTNKSSGFRDAGDLLAKALKVADELQRFEDGGIWLRIKQILRVEASDKLIRELRGFHAKSGSDIFAAR